MFVVFKGLECNEQYVESYNDETYTDQIWFALGIRSEELAESIASQLTNETGEWHFIRPKSWP